MLSKHLTARLNLSACRRLLPAEQYSQLLSYIWGACASAFYAAHDAAPKPVGCFIYF